MTNQEIKKTLEEQLQLLAKRSPHYLADRDRVTATRQMVAIAKWLSPDLSSEKIRKTLEEQLQLLVQCSKGCIDCDAAYLADQILAIAQWLSSAR